MARHGKVGVTISSYQSCVTLDKLQAAFVDLAVAKQDDSTR